MAAAAALLNPDRRIDCIGLFCPMPVLKARQALAAMVAGELLELLSDDPGSDRDVRDWARRARHELLSVTRSGPVYRFLIRKAG